MLFELSVKTLAISRDKDNMARILGTNIPDAKRVEISLTYIFGIGKTRSNFILNKLNINPDTNVRDLSNQDLERIRQEIEANFPVEGDLRSEIQQNIKRLKDINSYVGIRHIRKLPVRGQRTKTNARTKRGKKVTVGSGRKPAAQKT